MAARLGVQFDDLGARYLDRTYVHRRLALMREKNDPDALAMNRGMQHARQILGNPLHP
jgi:hypothetical protein